MPLSSVLASIPGVAGYEAGNEASNVNALSRVRTAEGVLTAQKMMEEIQKRRSVLDAVRNANGDYEAMSKGLAGVGDLAGAEHARRLGNEEAIARELPNALNPDGTLDYGKVSVLLAKRGNAGAALNAAQAGEVRKDKRDIMAKNRQSVLSMAGSPERPSLVDPQEFQQSADQGTPLPPAIAEVPSIVAGYKSDPQMKPHAEAFERLLRADPNMTPEQVATHLDRLGTLAKAYHEGGANRQTKVDIASMVQEGLDRRTAEKIAKGLGDTAVLRTTKGLIDLEMTVTNSETGQPHTREEATRNVLAKQIGTQKGDITPAVILQYEGAVRRSADDPKAVPGEVEAGLKRARDLAKSMGKGGNAPARAPPPQRAIDFLKKNPSPANKDQFKQYYGADPDQYLRQ